VRRGRKNWRENIKLRSWVRLRPDKSAWVKKEGKTSGANEKEEQRWDELMASVERDQDDRSRTPEKSKGKDRSIRWGKGIYNGDGNFKLREFKAVIKGGLWLSDRNLDFEDRGLGGVSM